jgi:hypothetical protein
MKGLKKGKKMEKVLRQGLRDWILVTAREQIFSEEMFAFPPSRVFLCLPARLPALCWGACVRARARSTDAVVGGWGFHLWLGQDPPFSPSLIDCDEAEADSSLQQKLRAGVRAMGGGISLESMLAQV